MGNAPGDGLSGVASPSGGESPSFGDLFHRSIRVEPVAPQSSLEVAVNAFLRTSSEVLPVVEGSSVVGALWREWIERALLNGVEKNTPVEFLMDRSPLVFSAKGSVEEAWKVLRSADRTAGIVVDEEGGYVGVVTAISLSSGFMPLVRLPVIGGLATPLGVYLSAGYVSAGAGRLGLFLAGVVLSLLYALALVASYGVVSLIEPRLRGMLEVGSWWEMGIVGLGFVFFLVFLRLSPLSGIHGAEHMVVHALERREVLAPERVGQMPKEHPRCGTNIMGGLVVFIVLITFLSEYLGEIAGLLAFLAVLLLWRRVGWFLQRWFTTKSPNLSQLQNGIAVGRELLEKLRLAGYREAGFLEKLVSSGLPWVVLGASLVGGFLWGLMKLAGFSLF